LQDNAESKDFERRVKIAELSLKEKEIDQNVEVVRMQTAGKRLSSRKDLELLKKAEGML
jgi:hypothetical protein